MELKLTQSIFIPSRVIAQKGKIVAVHLLYFPFLDMIAAGHPLNRYVSIIMEIVPEIANMINLRLIFRNTLCMTSKKAFLKLIPECNNYVID